MSPVIKNSKQLGMIIIGAKGFAKEVLEILHQNNQLEGLAFYDDVNDDLANLLYGKFPVLKNENDVLHHFKNFGNSFTIGIGGPKLRELLYNKFLLLGGSFTSTISTTSYIGNYGNQIDEGCNIMQKAVLTNDITLGKGVIINQMSSIGHDVFIGEFSEICPNVSISGNCTIGHHVFIGTGAIVLPKVTVGNNVIIGAGAVVSKSLPDNCVAVGIPAKIIKINND